MSAQDEYPGYEPVSLIPDTVEYASWDEPAQSTGIRSIQAAIRAVRSQTLDLLRMEMARRMAQASDPQEGTCDAVDS